MLKKYIINFGYVLSFVLPFIFLFFLFIKFEIHQDRTNIAYWGLIPFIIYFLTFSWFSSNLFDGIINLFSGTIDNCISNKKSIFWSLTGLSVSTLAILLDFIIFNFIKFLNLYEQVFSIFEVLLFFTTVTLLLNIMENIDKYYNRLPSNFYYFFKKKNANKNKKTSSKEAQILAAKVLIKVAKENNEPEMEKVGKDFLNKNK